jgi:hypothetical protein
VAPSMNREKNEKMVSVVSFWKLWGENDLGEISIFWFLLIIPEFQHLIFYFKKVGVNLLRNLFIFGNLRENTIFPIIFLFLVDFAIMSYLLRDFFEKQSIIAKHHNFFENFNEFENFRNSPKKNFFFVFCKNRLSS